MEILSIIPARSGSKGIPNKNIKKLAGKPLLAYSIEASIQSKYIDRTIVSTDSKKYAAISRKYGAEIPFLRPKYLAKDNIHAVYPVIDCIKRLREKENYIPNVIVMLLPTSPLRNNKHIDEAIALFMQKQEGSVISVVEANKPPHYFRVIKDGKLYPFINEEISPNFQRQDVNDIYELNGSIYVTWTKTLLKNKTFHVETIYPYIMEKMYSIDINEDFDFKIAEFLIKELNK